MQHRRSDTLFSWEKMLSFQGETAPYLQNAYVRIQSILRKEQERSSSMPQLGPIKLEEERERALAIQLLQFAEVVPKVLLDARPNILCLALFELANSFHRFYERCPILKAEITTKQSRLALAELTGRVLKLGLELLGISVPERM
jgi:arginyl-tRNA synthetase